MMGQFRKVHNKTGMERKGRVIDRPVIGDPFAESIVDDPVEDVVAHVGDGPLHPFDGDGAVRYVEVVFEELILGRTLPIKVFGNVGPETLRVFDGPLVEASVFVEAGDVCIPFVLLIRVDYSFLFGVSDRHIGARKWSEVFFWLSCAVLRCPAITCDV